MVYAATIAALIVVYLYLTFRTDKAVRISNAERKELEKARGVH